MDEQKKVEVCQEFIKKLNESGQTNQETYQSYAKVYDDLMETGYKVPEKLCEMCIHHLPQCTANTLILDVAAGTGRVGQAMKNSRFEGIIDGIEASSAMIQECLKKAIYRNLKVHFLSEDQPMPYPDSTFDAVVCAGALSLGHVPHQCIQDMLRVLKPEGILLFNISKLVNDPNNFIIPAVQKLMKTLVSEGRCKLMEEEADTVYHNEQFQMTDEAFFYCYKK